MSKYQVLLIAKLLAAIGFVFWVYYVLKYVLGAPFFLTTSEEEKLAYQVAFGIYGYLTLLVGVFLGAVYQELKASKSAGRPRVDIWQIIKGSLRSVDFWLGIFASPVVYAVLLQAVNMENLTLAGVVGLTLVGLQNGFVCNTLADSLISSKQDTQVAR